MAEIKVMEARKLMEAGRYHDAANLLKETVLQFPALDWVRYELAVTFFRMNKFKFALVELNQMLDSEDSHPAYFHLAGQCREQLADREMAAWLYQRGLELHPRSGLLYEAAGVLELGKKNMPKALENWERGIMVDPLFAPNYLRACRAFAYREEKVPALIYGEIYLNLERDGYYAPEIKRMLFRTYRDSIEVSDGMAGVNLNPKSLHPSAEGGWNEFSELYQLSLVAGVMQVRARGTIKKLSQIREQFIEYWFGMGFDQKYPNILFHRHRHLIDLGLFEAYNYWLMYDGNPAEVDAWSEGNGPLMDAFENWFRENPLRVQPHYAFHRFMY